MASYRNAGRIGRIRGNLDARPARLRQAGGSSIRFRSSGAVLLMTAALIVLPATEGATACESTLRHIQVRHGGANMWNAYGALMRNTVRSVSFETCNPAAESTVLSIFTVPQA